MEPSKQTKHQPTRLANHSGRIRLLTGVVVALLLLIAATIFFAPRLLVSSSIKQKIQATVTEKTGGRLDYQAIDLSFFPRAGIELQGVHLSLPKQLQGTIASLRISPKLLPLLTGNLQLSALELDTPQLSLTIPDTNADKIPAQPLTLTTLKDNLTNAIEAVAPMLPDLNIYVSKAQLTIVRSKQKLIAIAGLSLQGGITATDSSAAQVKLKTEINELKIFRQNHQETIKNISLSGKAQISADKITAVLNQLTLGQSNLELTGEFIFVPAEPNFILNLSASNIDVAASRTAALALAGDITPIKQIFDYLHGGRIPQIRFTSHGSSLSELGTLDNIHVEGQLQDGKISVPEVNLELSQVAGDVLLDRGILQGTGMSTRLKNSTGKNGSLQIGLTRASNLFLLELALNADLAEIYPWLASLEGLHDQLQKVQQVSGRIDMTSLKLRGPLDKPSAWEITSTGTLDKLSIQTELFPHTITIADGEFAMNPQQLSFKKLNAASQDAVLTLSGAVKGLPQQLDHLDLSLGGRMGAQSFKWLWTQLKLPDKYKIHTPFSIRDTQIAWQPNSTTSLKGLIELDNGPTITANVDYKKDGLQLHKLTVKDQYSDATIVFDRIKGRRDGKFIGRLEYESLQTLFINTAFDSGRLAGDLAFSGPQLGRPALTVKGQLTGDNLPLLLPSGDQVDIDHVMLQGDGSEIKVDIARLTWEDLSWAPVNATVSLKNDSAEIKFFDAKLCGINSPGTISITGDTFSVALALTGQNLDVATSYNCLTSGAIKMTGSLDFLSEIKATGQMDRLIKGMQGPLRMTFTNGLIQQDKMLSRVLEVLNVTEIIKGRLPKLTSNGFAYKTMTVQGRMQNGILTIDKYYMDGETLDLLGKGEINLVQRTVNMQLLAAPFQTVDSIVKHVPGINYLLAGSLVSIPVRVSGALTDPKVNVLSASAVSSSLLDLGKRTLESPFKLLDALNPWSKKK